MIGYDPYYPGSTHKFRAYDSSGQVWNGTAFEAWNDANFASYKITATRIGTTSRFTGTAPTGTVTYELIYDGASLALCEPAIWEENEIDTQDIKSRLPAALTANGNMKSSLMEILATALTETAGLLAGGFKKFFNVSSPANTMETLATQLKLKKYVQLIYRSDQGIAVDNSVEFTEINEDMGSGAGSADNQNHSLMELGTYAADIETDTQDIQEKLKAVVLQRTTIATLASQTSFTLTAGSADDDAYNNLYIVFQDASTEAQKSVRLIDDYTGANKTITLVSAPAFTIAIGDTVSIRAIDVSAIEAELNAPTLAEITSAIAQTSHLVILSPIDGSSMTVVQGNVYSSASEPITLTKAAGETGWPETITTIDFSCAPDDTLIAENSAAAGTGLDDIALTSVSSTGGVLSLTAAQTAALVATPGSGRYRFWYDANSATAKKTVRMGLLKVVIGDTN